MEYSVTMKLLEVLVYVFFLACVADKWRTQQDQFGGPFRLVLHEIGQCDETGTHQVYATTTRINKVSRTKYVYSTNFTSEIELSDTFTGVLDIAVFGNGGWRPHFMQMEFPNGCSYLKKMAPAIYQVFVRAIGSGCPIPPGTYEICNVDTESIQIGQALPTFPYGKYRSDFSISVNGIIVGCFRTYVDAVPAKISRRKKIPKSTS